MLKLHEAPYHYSQRAIAQQLGISRSAVRERLENAFRKLADGAAP